MTINVRGAIRAGLSLTFFACIFAQVVPFEQPRWPIASGLSSHAVAVSADGYSVSLSLNSYGTSFVREDQTITRLRIHLPDAGGYRLRLQTADFGENDRVFLRLIVSDGVVGPYRNNHLDAAGNLTTAVIFESDIVIEWTRPVGTSGDRDVILRKVLPYSREAAQTVAHPTAYRARGLRDNPVILLTGYWPPTNEMIRHFSQNPDLNPDGWQGEDWESRGYDVVSYFPTFDVPDCNDCGQGNGDLEVDYQDTSEDFWTIAEDTQPIAIITFSRGWIDHSWELEWNLVNRTNWIYDYTPPNQPTPNPPDQDHPSYLVRNSDLPLDSIVTAINAAGLGLNSYVDWNGNAGMFLSEFEGYHGTWYRGEHPYGDFPCLAAGHIHVGGQIDWDTARTAAEITLRQLTNYLDQFIYTPGDANSDGIINVQDLVVIVNYILGVADPDTLQFYAADINNDSIINVLDVIVILNLIVNPAG